MIILFQTTSFLLLLLLTTMLLLTNPKLLATANDTLNRSQTIRGSDTLVSSGERFELGFFTPGNSGNWYVGIWYKNVAEKTPVWVANRENPVKNLTSPPSPSAAAFTLTESGQLAVLDGNSTAVWTSTPTNTSTSAAAAARNAIAQLLDNGNLVLRDAGDDRPENYIWQSFDYLTDTFLPDMDFGWNYVNGKERYLSSWKTADDPAAGDYSHHIDLTGYAQGLTKKGENVTYRTGPWNGLVLSGTPNVMKDPTFRYGLYLKNNTYYVYRQDSIDRSVLSRITINPSGVVQRWSWVDRTQKWSLYLNMPADYCDNYKLCGSYGLCDGGNTPVCACLDRFVPRDPQGWARVDWSNGCVRRTPLSNCTSSAAGGGDGFKKYSNVKLPDARDTWHNESMSLEECRTECLKNCSCMAYTNLDVRGSGRGCILWLGDLDDMRVLSADGQDLYVRVASSELESNGKRKLALIIGLTIGGTLVLVLGVVAYVWRRKKKALWRRRRAMTDHEDLELPFFDLHTISRATDNFSADKKLGEGGYGPVYKGILGEGQQQQHIAVKRLSATSSQGLEEFKNEVVCISKLQHRNLVKLLGYCIHGEEKMLIYEYMPNKSLDLILFHVKNRKNLDSHTRLQIVKGIARGLMYLHQDSPLRIVHRDLKASNILLNTDMNPKISDFGLARIFKENETEDKTKRVAGTYGYMSPEYAVRGRYSVKSDVFSFGVLVLEIVTGEKNSSFSFGHNHINLLEHAWTLHSEERSLELVDSYLRDMNSMQEMIRLIHVGLLCVQQSPEDRPDMTSVVAMLSGGIGLPKPKQPGFFTHGEGDSSINTGSTGTRNEDLSGKNSLTITILESR